MINRGHFLKTKRRQNLVVPATKNPPQAAQQLLHAPDAVNRDYIGKIPMRKELFCAHKPRDIN
ncbi:MAG: hypothetical protein DMF21_09005 [Verrucomicrobia bacterium]|nr:MAG: hypothetical protein DMF09_13330 [Verrucomicrobiota bacterium]PYL80350.1 MAG: hypothetical protein DMF21_09005 [Verrucomicrobiota bacterium]